MASQAPFHPDHLDALAVPAIRPAIGVGGALVWRYTLLFPIAEGRPGEEPATIAGAVKLCNDIMLKLAHHFQGLTVLPPLQGFGLRDVNDASSMETNINWPLVVCASPIAASDRYLEALQEGVCSLLKQGMVLLERQDVFLLGSYYSTTSLMSWMPWQSTGTRLFPASSPHG